MDDKQIAAAVLANEYAYMGIAGVKHQITRLRLTPRDGFAVVVLTGCAAAMPDHIA